MQGVVKWFDVLKGYGFITGQDGDDYFVHHTAVAGEGWKVLERDAEVDFEIGESPSGKTVATNVRGLN